MTLPAACHFSKASESTSISTGKERDQESGNDYFGARYYGSSMGRFMSPDWSASPEGVPYAQLDNPQSLNLYGYFCTRIPNASGVCERLVLISRGADEADGLEVPLTHSAFAPHWPQ